MANEDEMLKGATVELLAPHFIYGAIRGAREEDRIIKNYTGPKSAQMRVLSKGKADDSQTGTGGTGGQQ